MASKFSPRDQVEGHGARELRDRFAGATVVRGGKGEVAMGKGVGGLEANRPGEPGEDLVGAVGRPKGDTGNVGGFGVERLQAEGGFQMGNR
jgi:hypothetical protein